MQITALILAGGRGTRMGGADKGLLQIDGEALVARLIARLAPQVSTILISANRNLDTYRAFGYPVLSDLRPDFAGPLAGLEAGLLACTTDWLLSCPSDTPSLPDDYIERMVAAAPSVAWRGGRMQPTFSLLQRNHLALVQAALDAGNLRLTDWAQAAGLRPVSFDDSHGALTNLNDLQALQHAQQ